MRVAYLSSTPFSDVDISYLIEAQKQFDITYFLEVTPSTRQKAAVDLSSFNKPSGIYCAADIKQFNKFVQLIDLSKVYVIQKAATTNHSILAFKENRALKKFLKIGCYDVIHLTWPLNYSAFSLYAFRKRMMLTVHDPFAHSSKRTRFNEFQRKVAFRLLDNFLILNKAQKNDFIASYHLEKKNIYESRLGRYDYLSIFKDDSLRVRNQIIFFGGIFLHKGVDYLLEAMELVHKQLPETKLIIAGKGEFWFDVEPYTRKDYIEFQNRYIPDGELSRMIQQSKFVVVPYIDATQSGVIMTAYVFDKPCISTNVGGLTEMVVDGVCGETVPPRDSKALASAIVSLLFDSDKLDAYSSYIRNNYSEGEKSWNYIANEMSAIYRKICV